MGNCKSGSDAVNDKSVVAKSGKHQIHINEQGVAEKILVEKIKHKESVMNKESEAKQSEGDISALSLSPSSVSGPDGGELKPEKKVTFLIANAASFFSDITEYDPNSMPEEVRNYVPTEREFLEAVEQGNVDKVRSLIKANVNINCKKDNENGRTAVHLAAENDDLRMIEVLLELGADVNSRDNSKETPLFGISEIDTIKYLVSKGADVNSRDAKGQTVFFDAAYEGNKEALEFYYQKFIDVNSRDNEGKTALFEAVLEGELDIIKQLKRYGADFNVVANNGETPIYGAIRSKNIETTKYLIKLGASGKIKNNNGVTPLSLAQSVKVPELVDVLSEFGGGK